MSVSVVIPTFNRAELVQKTIDSVLRQTYNDYEIIVIDDGSTDDTEQQLEQYADKITYIKQEKGNFKVEFYLVLLTSMLIQDLQVSHIDRLVSRCCQLRKKSIIDIDIFCR